MNSLRTTVFTFLFLAEGLLSTLANASPGDMEVLCTDSFYSCLTGEELNFFAGKTFKYKHPRASDFGVVTVTFKSNGDLQISNAKSSSGGTWKINSGQVDLNPIAWGEKYSFRFVKINERMFVIPNHGTGGVSLTPLEIIN
jgi:hypothetical protein